MSPPHFSRAWAAERKLRLGEGEWQCDHQAANKHYSPHKMISLYDFSTPFRITPCPSRPYISKIPAINSMIIMVVLDHAAWVGIKQGVCRNWFFLALVLVHPVNPGDANQHRLNEMIRAAC
jgi:hypothetical protein